MTNVQKPPTFPGNQRMKPTQRQGFLAILRPWSSASSLSSC